MAENEKPEDNRQDALMWTDCDRGIWIACGVKSKSGMPYIDRINGAERLPFNEADNRYGPLVPIQSAKRKDVSGDDQ